MFYGKLNNTPVSADMVAPFVQDAVAAVVPGQLEAALPGADFSAAKATAAGSIAARAFGARFRDRLNLLDFYAGGSPGSGSNDDTAAVTAALAEGVANGETVFVPAAPVCYRVGDVTVPIGARMVGQSHVSYGMYTGPASTQKKATFKKIAGAGCLWNVLIDFSFENLIFDGEDNTVPLFLRQNDANHYMRALIRRCGIFRWSIGLGGTGTGRSRKLQTALIDGCVISKNTVGIMNVMDSVVVNNILSYQTSHALQLESGSSTNRIALNHFEFSGGNHINLDGVKGITVLGNVFDRSALSGLSIRKAEVDIIGGVIKRNGSANTTDDNFNVLFRPSLTSDYGRVQMLGVKFVQGEDDGGGGNISPATHVRFLPTAGGESHQNVVIMASDLSGATTPYDRSGASFNELIIRDNTGAEDVVLARSPAILRGQNVVSGGTVNALAVGATSSTVTAKLGTLLSSGHNVYTLRVSSRASSTFAGGELRFLVGRNGTGNALIGYTALGPMSAVNAFGTTGSDAIQITLGTVATDGSSINFTIKNNSAAIQNYEWRIV